MEVLVHTCVNCYHIMSKSGTTVTADVHTYNAIDLSQCLVADNVCPRKYSCAACQTCQAATQSQALLESFLRHCMQ